MYSDLTINNKSLLKRFSHGRRFQMAIDLLKPCQGDRILDYGTGDGFMLKAIHSKNIRCEIVGYEPVPQMYQELIHALRNQIADKKIRVIFQLEDISGKFNKICCLEVLEHLPEESQKRELLRMKNALTENGALVISVPIEVGCSSLAKNMARLLLRQTHQNTTILTVIKSTFGVKIDRGNSSYISTHIGFYYADLENLFISLGLKVIIRQFSPIKILRGLVNSQIFYLLQKES